MEPESSSRLTGRKNCRLTTAPFKTGVDIMTDLIISVAPTKIAAQVGDQSFTMVLLLCSAGLIASFGLMTVGMDLGTGWI
jgi:hypothetical protein